MLLVDASNNNGVVDWRAARDQGGAQGGIIKVAEGTGFVDRFAHANLTALADLGMVRGVYDFARPSMGPPVPQANLFLSLCKGWLRPGDLVALDYEDEYFTGDGSEWALAWLSYVQGVLGFPPIFYSYWDYLVTRQLQVAKLAKFNLWFASYQSQRPQPPPQWPSILIWQRSGGAQLAGFSGLVDLNECDLTLDQLRGYGMPVDAGERERQQLLADAAAVPAWARGNLIREGVVDLTPWGGGEEERLAIYEKARYHRLNGTSQSFFSDGPTSYQALFTAGRVVLYG